MPLELVRIRRVHQSATVNATVTRFDIDAETLSDPPRLRQYQTIHAWRASACEAARRLHLPILIGSRDTKYGAEVITADLQKASA